MSESSSDPSAEGAKGSAARKPSGLRRLGWLVGGLALAYLVTAYLVMPLWWDRYEHRHPALDSIPGITQTTVGIPADPVNVAVIGTKEQLVRCLLAAKWAPADALSLKSDVKIAADTVLGRPYEEAPVSSLYLFGRKEDLAFEKPVGNDPRKRNHVRFWQAEQADADGRPVWVGSASFDKGVGLSHTTGEVTHHIAADVDVERDRLVADLEGTGLLSESFTVPGFHKILEGRNGGGDPWRTDGALGVCVVSAESGP